MLPRLSRADGHCVLAILAVFSAITILVNPLGDFPLNDDWAYGWSVRHFLETGEFRLSDWAAANLFTQVVWGALFCRVFGFSFTVLRFSTLVLAAIGTLALYGLLRELRIAPRSALVGTLTLALAPIQLQQAHSFNNDVPSSALLVVAAFLLLRGLLRESPLATAAGLATGFLAVLTRQSNVVLFAAYGLSLLVARGLRPATLVKAILPGLAALSLHLGYVHWLSVHDRKPLLYDLQVRMLWSTLASDPRTIAATYVGNLSVLLMYAGLFLLPLLVYCVAVEQPRRAPHRTLTLVVVAALVGVSLLTLRVQMPLLGNTLLAVGLGPPAAPGNDAGLSRIEHLVVDFGWKVATVAAVAGVALLALRFAALAARVIDPHVPPKARASAILIMAGLAFYVAGIAGVPRDYLFDRYLLPFLAFAIPAISLAAHPVRLLDPVPPREPARLSRASGFLVFVPLLAMAWYAVVTVHDYMASHRVRWRAIDALVHSEGVPLTEIDGGFEFSGWNRGNRFETCSPGRDRSEFEGRAQWKDFDCIWEAGRREPYAFSFTERPGYNLVAVQDYFSWQFLTRKRILTLSRLRAP